MSKQPFTPSEFKDIFSKIPRLCIDPIVRTPNGIILSLRQGGIGWEGQWHLPGGTLLYREPVEDGLRRILREELGIEVKVLKLLGYIEFASELQERGFGYSVSLAILCDLLSGSPQPDKNSSEVKIFSNLPSNLISEQKNFLLSHWDDITENKF